jgi:TP901 family phage tail tape measure protein
MSNAITTWTLKFTDAISAPMGRVKAVTDSLVDRTDKLGQCFKRINAIDLQAISQSAQNLNDRFANLNAPFISYESGLAEVSAITGVTGKQLDDLGKKAKDSAEKFGGSATDSLTTYKTLLSRLGPDIAKSPEALAKMEENVRTLSKTMGNDAVGSVDALTTAMLQYGVDLSNPVTAQQEMTNMMNVMAAGAKEGAAEVPAIADALKVAGVQAKQSNVSFAETNAVLQELSKGGKNGAEAGTALRNVLAKMSGEDVLSKDAIGKLDKMGVNMKIVSDTTLPLTTRLRELKKAQGDATAVAQIFGIENAAAANIMLNSVDAQDTLKDKIEGTTAATDQAAIMMGTTAEKQSRWNATIENAKIKLGEYTAAFTPYVSAGANGISIMADLKNAHDGAKIAMNGLKTMMGLTENQSLLSAAKTKIVTIAQGVLTGVTSLATMAQTGLNAAMAANPIGVVIIGVMALVAGVILIISYWDSWGAALSVFLGPLGLVISLIQSFRRHWHSITEAFTKGGIVAGIKRIGLALLDALLMPVQQLLELLAKLPGMGGIAGAGASWIKGMRKGLELTEGDPKEAKAKTKAKTEKESAVDLGKKPAGVIPPTGLNLKNLGTSPKDKTKAKGEGSTSGSGDNNVSKSIVQNLTINNHFGVDGKMNIRQLTDEIAGLIIDKLRDGVISIA